jgi:hypothetical protein
MIIKFEEILDRESWIGHEILRSIRSEVINELREAKEYDIKILINGHEHEPKLLIDLYENIEKYIDDEANTLLNAKLDQSKYKINDLDEIISEAISKVKDSFGLESNGFFT